MEHFNWEEFACNCGCGRHIDKMNKEFLYMLDEARGTASVPFIITSGYRCPVYNMTVGGKDNSAHKYGLAADIQCLTSSDRFLIVDALIAVGFDRIGIGHGFIHVDYDLTKPTEMMWDYYK